MTDPWASKLKGERPSRRYVRVPGPFEGYYLGPQHTPIRIYDLSLGGGFVNFTNEQPAESTLALTIELPNEPAITVKAEKVYSHQFGAGVRFIDVDDDSKARLIRTCEGPVKPKPRILP